MLRLSTWLLLVLNSNAGWLLGPKYSTSMRATLVRAGIVVVSFFLVAIGTAKADIQIDRTRSDIRVWITNTIKETDEKQLQAISADLEFASLVTVWLDSKGGDLSAAIKIGKLVRKYDGQTIIEGKCYSSCALIFIAGVQRVIFSGELGLHRPYLSALPQSRETVEKQVPLMLSTLKTYVTEMGITDNFYQQMVNTEPSRMVKYYSYNYTNLLPELDPVHAEIEIAHKARRYGITTSEMRQREQDEKSCDGLRNDPSRWLTCTEAIDWGLSERVYVERHAKVDAACEVSDEERAKGDKTPYKLHWDLPFMIRAETCQRHIMLDPAADDEVWEDVK